MSSAALAVDPALSNWVASGTSANAQNSVLWRPPSGYQIFAGTALASSGTIVSCAPFRAYACLFGLATVATGAMYVLAFDADNPARQQWAQANIPALTHSMQAEAPWTGHIVALRKDLGLAVGALVAALGVSRQTYYDWLRGETPNPNNQKRIATLAAIAADWVAIGRGPMSRYWQLPTSPTVQGLREFLLGETISVEQFQTVLANLGLKRRLLPPRTTTPRVVLRDGNSRRTHGARKAWHVEPKESD